MSVIGRCRYDRIVAIRAMEDSLLQGKLCGCGGRW